MTPTASTRARKDICSSAGVVEQLGLCTEDYSDSDGPGSAIEPPSCTTLVALDSAAAPLKLQQKLSKRWRKKWAKLYKRQIRKQKLKQVEDELRKAFQEGNSDCGGVASHGWACHGCSPRWKVPVALRPSPHQAHKRTAQEAPSTAPLHHCQGLEDKVGLDRAYLSAWSYLLAPFEPPDDRTRGQLV